MDLTRSRPRLDPQALPPATTARFALLIATTMVTATYLYAWLVASLDLVSGAPAQCAQLARSGAGRVLPMDLITWYSDCLTWAALQQAGLVGAILAGLVVLSLAIYLATPWRLRRGLIPLATYERDEAGRNVGEFIRRQAAAMGQPRVAFYVDIGNDPSHAFGRLGRYEVALRLQTVERWHANREDPALVTELRHELAHISNRDVDLTYLALAVWWAFLATLPVPVLIVAVNAPSRLPDLLWRLAILTGLVWLIRLSVLRSREYYADVRAAGSTAEEAVIGYMKHGLRQDRRARLELFATHPTPDHRVDAVEHGDRLFRLSVGVAAATGALVGLAFTPASSLLGLLLPQQLTERSWVSGVLFGLLIAGVLAGAAWRGALWSIAEGGRRFSTLPAAVAFTTALLLGQMATPRLPGSATWGDLLGPAPAVAAVMACLLLAGVQVYLRWTVHCASVWLPVVRRPRAAYLFGIGQSAVVLGLWLGAWFELVNTLTLDPSFLTLGLMPVFVLFDPPKQLALAWAFAYPTLAWRSPGLNPDTAPQWWRPGEVEPGERLPEQRPPVGAVYLVCAATVLGYSLLLVPDYPALRATLDVIHSDPDQPGLATLELLRRLLFPLLWAATGSGLLAGVLLGGRRSTARATMVAGLAALPGSIVMLTAIVVHLTTADPTLRDPTTILKGLAGVGDLAPEDRPENPALGLMLLAMFGGLVVIYLASATVGSAVRALLPRRPTLHRPGRPIGQAVAWAAPLLLAGLAVGYLGWTQGRVPLDVTISQSIDLRDIDPVLASARSNTMTVTDSCAAILVTLGGDPQRLTESVPTGEFDRHLAEATAFAIASTDPTLQTFGHGVAQALNAKQLQLAATGVINAVHYCAVTLT